MDEARIYTFAQGVLVGVLVGALLTLAVGPGLSGGGAGVSVPSQSTTVGNGCGDDLPPDRGWATVVGTPNADVVAVNLTVPHDAPNRTVRPELRSTGDGVFVYALTPVETSKDPDAPAGCRAYSTVDASLALPRDYETLRVTYDGERVATVAGPDDSAATLYRVSVTAG